MQPQHACPEPGTSAKFVDWLTLNGERVKVAKLDIAIALSFQRIKRGLRIGYVAPSDLIDT